MSSSFTPLDEVSTSMSPNSRQRKRYYAKKWLKTLKSFNLNESEEKQVIVSALKSLNLYNGIKGEQSAGNKGRKPTTLHTRKQVWDLWHDNSQESSDTTRPAKLWRINRPKIRSGLSFPTSVKVITQRGKSFLRVCGKSQMKQFLITIISTYNYIQIILYYLGHSTL